MMKIIDLNVHLESWRKGKRDGVMANLYNNKPGDVVPDLAGRKVRFDYPLEKAVEVDFAGNPTIEKFIDFVVASYGKIYRDDPDNIWGHGIGDLFLEGVAIRNGGKLDLLMGS